MKKQILTLTASLILLGFLSGCCCLYDDFGHPGRQHHRGSRSYYHYQDSGSGYRH